ncbi:hypothetical protein GCM10022235_33930 [Kribbella ginsengisoli]|uniref:Uncharacterized protein n=1 Tax=Kribbella ginsengisoli TaxID=363865 RepID=A0ABP6X9U3_9ACTN
MQYFDGVDRSPGSEIRESAANDLYLWKLRHRCPALGSRAMAPVSGWVHRKAEEVLDAVFIVDFRQRSEVPARAPETACESPRQDTRVAGRGLCCPGGLL